MEDKIKNIEMCIGELLDGFTAYFRAQRAFYDDEQAPIMADMCEDMYELVEQLKEYLA